MKSVWCGQGFSALFWFLCPFGRHGAMRLRRHSSQYLQLYKTWLDGIATERMILKTSFYPRVFDTSNQKLPTKIDITGSFFICPLPLGKLNIKCLRTFSAKPSKKGILVGFTLHSVLFLMTRALFSRIRAPKWANEIRKHIKIGFFDSSGLIFFKIWNESWFSNLC